MATTVMSLVGRLVPWIDPLMPVGPRQTALIRDLRERFGDDGRPLTDVSCAEIEATAQRHSRHLVLQFDPDGTASPDEEAKGWPPDDPEDVRRRAAALTRVERTAGHAAVIRLDALEPLALAQPYLAGAFALAAGSQRVVGERSRGGSDHVTPVRMRPCTRDPRPAGVIT